MWTLISGYIISIIFEHLTIKLHKNNLSNKNMSIFGIILGWLFQEHVRQDFNMTGGKRFMLKRDFRNRFVTQTVKVIRNVIFWVHAINIFELGTFLVLFSFFLYLFTKTYFNKKYLIKFVKSLNRLTYLVFFEKFKSLESFTTALFLHFYRITSLKLKDFTVIVSFVIFFKYGFFKIYGWFDFFFVIRPFFYMLMITYILISSFWFVYLFYFFIISYLPKTFGYIINICAHKIYFYLIFICFLCDLVIEEINLENLITENFFKELLLKLLFFFL